MTKRVWKLATIAAVLVCGTAASCVTDGVKVVRDSQPVFFSGAKLEEAPPPNQTEAIRALGARAAANMGSDEETVDTRANLALISGLSHYWFNERDDAGRAFGQGVDICEQDGRTRASDRPCAMLRAFQIRNVGLTLLAGDAPGTPRGTPQSAELTGEQWRTLAGVAERYNDSVFTPWRDAPIQDGSQTEDFDREIRGRAACSYRSAYDNVTTWRTAEGGAAMRAEAYQTILSGGVSALESTGAALPTACEGSRGEACLDAAWSAVGDMCRNTNGG